MLLDLTPGTKHIVNGSGDLFMDYDLRPVIGNEVEVVQVNKSGTVQVLFEGKLYSLTRKNLGGWYPNV